VTDAIGGLPKPASDARYPLGSNPSFIDVVRSVAPESLASASGGQPSSPGLAPLQVPHGTTVLALRFDTGVVMAGDRRAVEGFSIADERIEKVFPADEYSTVAIAGAAGQATEIVRLFQTELEHYEKVEGERLSLEGKANRLAQMIRANFPMALQGLVVVPLFAGYDTRRREGRIYRYDVTGGRWEEADYHATGSGGVHARGTLKKRWRQGLDRAVAVRVAVEALWDASQEDVATGGPMPARGVFPSVKVVTEAGIEVVSDDELRSAVEWILDTAGQVPTWVATSPAREEHDVPGASHGGGEAGASHDAGDGEDV
jgi:proteasome beta subunit